MFGSLINLFLPVSVAIEAAPINWRYCDPCPIYSFALGRLSLIVFMPLPSDTPAL